MSHKEDLRYEDVVVGGKVVSAPHTITMDDILGFALVTRDRHPLHTDEEYARQGPYGKPVAHGLFGLALMEGLKTELRLYQNTSIASLGWDKVRFKAPIFPGDTVHVESTFLSKRPSSRAGRGIVVEGIELINQHGAVVIEAEHAMMIVSQSGQPAA